MDANCFVSRVHRKKPKRRAIARRTAGANGRKSKVCSHVEHVFAERKSRMGLMIRTIGIARATLKIGMANIVYKIKRLICLRKIAVAQQHPPKADPESISPPSSQTSMRLDYAPPRETTSPNRAETALIEPSGFQRRSAGKRCRSDDREAKKHI